LGANGLAALNFGISVYSILHGFGLMIGIGGATKYSILKSKNDANGANSIFTHSFAAGLFVGLIFAAFGVFLSTQLAKILGADIYTLPMARVYIKTILCFSPFFFLNNLLFAFIRNDNNPKLAMAGMVTGSISNIALDYIFLFPLQMGMFGAALATCLSIILSVCVLSLHFWTKHNRFILCKCKIFVKKIIKIISLGASAFIGEMSFAIALITFNLVILRIEGNVGVAAYGIVANIAIIPICIFTGVAQGIQPLISKGYGIGDNVLIRKNLKYAITLVFALALVVYGIIYFYSAGIVSAFNSEENITLALLATNGARIYFIGIIFAGVNIVATAFFSAVTSAKTGLFISLLRSCALLIPAVIVLSLALKMNGVWLSFVFTELIVGVLSIIFLYCKIKEQ
jgi:Na+-driven multidrug efflux pump